jgi:hypothetical protein
MLRAGDPERIRSAAILLPIASSILLLPPFILVFAAPVLVSGVPLIVIYVFGVWTAIVLAALLLSRRLEPAEPSVNAGAGEGLAGTRPDAD